MARKNVIKTIAVSPSADNLIENIVVVTNYHKLHLNGEKSISVSGLIGFIFEMVVNNKDKEQKLIEFLKLVELKDQYGEPLKIDDLKRIIKEINERK